MYLTVKDLKNALKVFQQENDLTDEEFDKIPIFIGDDEELNGVHGSFYCNIEDTKKAKYTWKDMEDGKVSFDDYVKQSIAMQIKEYDEKIKGKVILIS